MSLHWIKRNVLTALFLQSGFDYQLFIDSDVEFEPDVHWSDDNSI